MSNILVVAAHPDDEILGVGATIKKRVVNGDVAKAIILGEGQTSRWNSRDEAPVEVIEGLHKNTIDAANRIGYSEIIFADFPDNRFDEVALLDIVKRVEEIIKEFKPDIIYTHHGGDLNIDHQRTFQAVITATRTVGDYSVKEIYAFETLSSTEWNYSYNDIFKPNVFEDVTDFFDSKIKAMKCYESELCEFPHPRSLRGLEITAQKWGSVVGRTFVEPFMLIRKVED